VFAHHIAKDFFETTERLGFKRQPQPQISAVRPKAFAERPEVGLAELFRANDVYACNDVMSLHWSAMDASQLALLATEHDRAREKHAN
jgi:hypothetical protein